MLKCKFWHGHTVWPTEARTEQHLGCGYCFERETPILFRNNNSSSFTCIAWTSFLTGRQQHRCKRYCPIYTVVLESSKVFIKVYLLWRGLLVQNILLTYLKIPKLRFLKYWWETKLRRREIKMKRFMFVDIPESKGQFPTLKLP